jgi:hypothetical protein
MLAVLIQYGKFDVQLERGGVDRVPVHIRIYRVVPAERLDLYQSSLLPVFCSRELNVTALLANTIGDRFSVSAWSPLTGAYFRGPGRAALAAIKAKIIILTIDHERYFPPVDAEYEASNIQARSAGLFARIGDKCAGVSGGCGHL